MLAKMTDPKWVVKWLTFLAVGAIVCGAMNKYIFKT